MNADEAVRPDPIAEVREAREHLSSSGGAIAPDTIRKVVVVLSSSRGGSSLLFSLLRATGAFMSLPGEHTHLYKLYGLGAPNSGMHDGWTGPAPDVDGFRHGLLSEATAGDAAHGVDAGRFPYEFAARLIVQWPHLAPHADQVVTTAAELLDSRGTERFDADSFLLAALTELATGGHAVDPWYYDIPASAIEASGWKPSGYTGPPPGVRTIIEEPPFLVPRPQRPASSDPDGSTPLLLKASVDAYRVETIPKLFPAADIHAVHLVRNPAAAVNGLIDGWLHRGFYSHDVSSAAALNIAGYSHLSWGDSWWNFDLPPGWENFVDSPLPVVCGLQWQQAHTSIVASLEQSVISSIRVRAEDLFHSRHRRHILKRIFDHVGVAADDVASAADRVRPVMATAAPRPARWRDRAELLAPVLATPGIREVSRLLGYGEEPDQEWI